MRPYFETSSLLKLLIEEEGSEEADQLWDTTEIPATSRLTYAEARAAAAAARRGERLTRRGLEDAKRTLEERFAVLNVIEVTHEIIRSAGELAERHALRAYDAVQLASALVLGTEDAVFVTWDVRLARAAVSNGLDVAGARP